MNERAGISLPLSTFAEACVDLMKVWQREPCLHLSLLPPWAGEVFKNTLEKQHFVGIGKRDKKQGEWNLVVLSGL